jgi:hypothetical protein
MIAAFVLIVGNADCTAIVQTLVPGLYPESVVGILKSIVFGLLTAPLTCNCSWGVSEETNSVPFDTSIAWRSDKVVSGAELSTAAFTVIVARSWAMLERLNLHPLPISLS